MARPRARSSGGAALAAALLAACSARSATADPRCRLIDEGTGPRGSSAITAEKVVDGLEVPWSLAFLPDGSLLVTERPGRLRRVEGGRLLPDPVAVVTTDPGGEGGLQGLALHPDFAKTRAFFLFFTTAEGGRKENRVERWKLAADGRSAVFDRRLLAGLPAAQFHHGGRLRIGPDRMLYVSVGDARVPDAAQDPRSPSGKLLRLSPDAPGEQSVTPETVFLTGLRNSEGFDWRDPKTLYVTDHGPSGELGRRGHDEVSVVHRGDNLGWPLVSGCDASAGKVSPSLSWTQAVPPGGAATVTSDRIPGWRGSLVIGTLGSRHLHRVAFAPDGTVDRHEVYFEGNPPGGLGRLREVALGPDGHLYVTTSNCDGRGTCPATKDAVYRILPAGRILPQTR